MKVLACILMLVPALACADYPYSGGGMPGPQITNTNPNTSTTNGASGDFNQSVQQQTQQALQVFQNVNYKSFSTDQQDFMNSDDSSDDDTKVFNFQDLKDNQ